MALPASFHANNTVGPQNSYHGPLLTYGAFFHFDASDAGPTDNNAVWTNDSNAFDGSESTAATTTTIGSTNWLEAFGTNAPGSGGTINGVCFKVLYHDTIASTMGFRVQSGSDNLYESALATVTDEKLWTEWQNLTTPTGGWTWAKLQALDIQFYKISGTGTLSIYKILLCVSTDSSSDGTIVTAILGGRTQGLVGAISVWQSDDPVNNAFHEGATEFFGGQSVGHGSIWTYQKGGVNGDIIDVVAQKSATAPIPRHATFTVSTGQLTAATTIDSAPAGDDGPNAFACTVVREATGSDIVAIYQGEADKDMGTKYARIDAARWTGAAWGSPISIDGAGGASVHYTGPVAVLGTGGTGDNVHIWLKDHTNKAAYMRTLRADDSLDTLTNVNSSLGNIIIYNGGRGVGGATITIPYRYDTDGTVRVLNFTSADSPTYGSPVTGISDSATLTGQSTVFGLAADGSDVHLLYSRASDQDIYHDSDVDGGGTTDTEVLDAVSANHISPNIYDRSGLKLAYIYNDGGTIKYNEVDIGVAAPSIYLSMAPYTPSMR